MRNWLGQEVLPGAVVYRGARQGNSSEFKVGVVESVAAGTARVHYKYESGSAYRGSTREYVRGVPITMNSKGSPAVDSLVVLDDSVLARLDQVMFWIQKWKDDQTMTTSDLKSLIDTLV